MVGRALNLTAFLKRKRKFENFISTHETFSKERFTQLSELESFYKNSDNVFISGGDQLWNDYHPCGHDNAYKLTFTDSKKRLLTELVWDVIISRKQN